MDFVLSYLDASWIDVGPPHLDRDPSAEETWRPERRIGTRRFELRKIMDAIGSSWLLITIYNGK